MEGKRFDQLTRAVATSGSRRRVLGAILAGALGSLRIRSTAADDEGTAIADASGGNRNVATVVDPAPNGNDHDRDHHNDTCAKAGELRKEGKPCCNDLVKDDDDRCVRPQSLDRESGDGGGGEGENPAAADCGPTPCPADQSTASTGPGRCCNTGFCSCGNECCEGRDCWIVTETRFDPPIVRETCNPGVTCVSCSGDVDECCNSCAPGGGCIHNTPVGGGSIRRR